MQAKGLRYAVTATAYMFLVIVLAGLDVRSALANGGHTGPRAPSVVQPKPEKKPKLTPEERRERQRRAIDARRGVSRPRSGGVGDQPLPLPESGVRRQQDSQEISGQIGSVSDLIKKGAAAGATDVTDVPPSKVKVAEPPALTDMPPPLVAEPPALTDMPPPLVAEPPALTDMPPPLVAEPPALTDMPPPLVAEPPALTDMPPPLVAEPPALTDMPPPLVAEPPALTDMPPSLVAEPPDVTTGVPSEEAAGPTDVTTGVPSEEAAGPTDVTTGVPSEEAAGPTDVTTGVPSEEAAGPTDVTTGVPPAEAAGPDKPKKTVKTTMEVKGPNTKETTTTTVEGPDGTTTYVVTKHTHSAEGKTKTTTKMEVIEPDGTNRTTWSFPGVGIDPRDGREIAAGWNDAASEFETGEKVAKVGVAGAGVALIAVAFVPASLAGGTAVAATGAAATAAPATGVLSGGAALATGKGIATYSAASGVVAGASLYSDVADPAKLGTGENMNIDKDAAVKGTIYGTAVAGLTALGIGAGAMAEKVLGPRVVEKGTQMLADRASRIAQAGAAGGIKGWFAGAKETIATVGTYIEGKVLATYGTQIGKTAGSGSVGFVNWLFTKPAVKKALTKK
jgi:hypothetical protein